MNLQMMGVTMGSSTVPDSDLTDQTVVDGDGDGNDGGRNLVSIMNSEHGDHSFEGIVSKYIMPTSSMSLVAFLPFTCH